jgi:hypothetical protein
MKNQKSLFSLMNAKTQVSTNDWKKGRRNKFGSKEISISEKREKIFHILHMLSPCKQMKIEKSIESGLGKSI